jgi:predicted DNA-binding protein
MEEAKKSMVVSVRLSPEVHARLQALARADKRKLASYLTIVLEEHLERTEAEARETTKPLKGRR